MSEYSPVMKELVRRILANNKKARMSGSAVNKSAYLAGGGPDHTYHLSYNEVPHDNGYTVHYPQDRLFPNILTRKKDKTYATGFDISYTSAAEMQRMTKVLYNAIMKGDKRVACLMELAGTMNGRDVVALDNSNPKRPYRTYGWDSTHLYHNHGGIRRRWISSARLILPLAELWVP